VNAGKVKELWVEPSQIIEILAGDKYEPIKGYAYKPDKKVVLPPEEVIHLKYWTPDYLSGSNLYGMSPIRAGRKVVSKSDASYDAATSAMQNSGMMGFIAGNEEQTGIGLTEEQAIALQERLRIYTKAENKGKIPVTSYNLKWQQMGMSPTDLNIIESDKMDLRTLCSIYHVPSELFNDAANKTYSNTQEAARAIWVNAVIPQLTQFRDAFNNHINRRNDQGIWVDYDTSVVPELQDDVATQVSGLKEAYWITPNERRVVMGWDESDTPEMDMMWIPSGLIPMEGYQEQQEADALEAEAQLSQIGETDEEVDKHLKELGIDDYAKD
jgi:HK97 family phage portal protein